MSKIIVDRVYIETKGSYRFFRTQVREEMAKDFKKGWWFFYITINIDKQIADKSFADKMWLDEDSWIGDEFFKGMDERCTYYRRFEDNEKNIGRRVTMGFDVNITGTEPSNQRIVDVMLIKEVDFLHKQTKITEWQ